MPLTPKQFNKLATKDDLKDLEKKLVSKKEFTGKIDQVLTAVDGLAKNVQDFQTELASNQTAHDRYQKSFEAIEKRLLRIELRTGIKTKK